MKYLIIGKNGLISSHISQYFRRDDIPFVITTKNNPESKFEFHLSLDGDDNVPDEILEEYNNIIFLAAISSPDICTNDYGYAYSINVTGTSRFMERCLSKGAKVLFISSDTVYGGKQVPVDEETIPDSLDSYAFMKRKVENLFETDINFYVARLSYVISRDDKYLKYLSNCSADGVVAEIYHPLYRNCIWLNDVIISILEIFTKWDSLTKPCINLVGPELLSRLDIANLYKEVVAPDLSIKVVKPNEEFFKSRPEIISVKSLYLESLLGRKVNTIKEALINEHHSQNE